MKLQSLTLTNFQGIKSLKLELNGHDASIYGENATGKTTIYNAFAWLLTGKSGTGEKNYSPKTRDDKGGEVHNLDHCAEAVLKLDGGAVVTLKKIYHEVYKKKRGSADSDYAGNTIDHYIDGVPTKEKLYAKYIQDNIAGEEGLRMLTMIDYFLKTMHWKERRAVLVDLCGGISDEEIMQSGESLHELPDVLAIPGSDGRRYSVDEYRKIAVARKAEINKRLDNLPERIDEATRSIPDLAESLSVDGIRRAIEEVNRDLNELRGRREMLTASSEADRINAELVQLQAEREDARSRHNEQEAQRFAYMQKQVTEIGSQIADHTANAAEMENRSAALSRSKEEIAHTRKRLLQDWNDTYAKVWNPEAEICPTCGQRLQEDRIEALRADFNEQRSHRLEEITQKGKGKASETIICKMADEIKRCLESAAAERDSVVQLEAQRDNLTAQINPAPFDSVDFDRRKQELFMRLKDINETVASRTIEVDERISELEHYVQSLNHDLMEIELAERQSTRIKELEREEKTLAEEYEQVERGLFLCEQFVRRKVTLLDERINGMFSSVRFKLCEEQLNGGLKDCCEGMIPSPDGALVAYPDANSAAKINAGMEVIQALSGYFHADLPVFVDNAESITHLTPIKQQVIRLVVLEGADSIRLEVSA